ncbi:hypothetical protein [Leptospira weilii]|uniref:hypothetical protein n=1 Tax=Leptospira weilii TaxID=28184 RepID=UPI00055C1C46|nr:hypothetical protein [Leptospira weilii]
MTKIPRLNVGFVLKLTVLYFIGIINTNVLTRYSNDETIKISLGHFGIKLRRKSNIPVRISRHGKTFKIEFEVSELPFG